MHNIHQEAKWFASKYKQSLLVTLLYVGLYMSLRDLLVEFLGFAGLIVVFVTLAIEHGKVKVGLDVIEQNSFVPQQEAAVGIKQHQKYFSTYLWMNIIMVAFVFIALTGVFFLFRPYFLSLLSSIETEMQYGIDATLLQMYSMILLITKSCLMISEMIFNTFFFTAPYLNEVKGITGPKAIVEAVKLQKGHFIRIIKTFLPYYGFMICFTCIRFITGAYINQLLLLSIIDIVITLLSILTYESEYIVCKALLYTRLVEENNHDYFKF